MWLLGGFSKSGHPELVHVLPIARVYPDDANDGNLIQENLSRDAR
jgi:hypothetical protein